MLKDQCISVTELRTRTRECLEGLDSKPKYVFINNHPVAVLLNIDSYEQLFQKTDLIEMEIEDVDDDLRELVKKARKLSKKELVDL